MRQGEGSTRVRSHPAERTKGGNMKKIRFLSIVLAVVIVLVSVQPILAKQPDKVETDYEKAVAMLEEFLITTESGEIVLDAPNKVVRKIDSGVYQSIVASLEQTNQMIDEGYLECKGNFDVVVTEKYLHSTKQMVRDPLQYETSTTWYGVHGPSGRPPYYSTNRVVWYWWGFKLYLNNYTCIRLAAGLSVAAAICLLIPDPLASKVAAIVMGVFAASIVAANVYGRGVIISFYCRWMFPTLVVFPFSICSQ